MANNSSEIDYSIIVCTYNPDERVFSRCLAAVSSLDFARFNVEIIIVDNNSNPGVSGLECIKKLNSLNVSVTLIAEPKQGLVHARIAGIEEAKGKKIVFFDDDNEPDQNYIIQLDELYNRYPEVGAWGPGTVDVDFIDGVDPKAERYLRPIFQEKKQQFTEFALKRVWQECYPVGTGLSIKKSLLESYLRMVREGRITLSGRSADKMTSGDDTQIIMLAIAQSAAAGTSPNLKMTHMISAKKTEFGAVKRLIFGTSSCYHLFHLEVLPEYKEFIKAASLPSASKLYFKVLKKYSKLKLKKGSIKETIKLVEFLGLAASLYLAKQRELPYAIKWGLKKLGL